MFPIRQCRPEDFGGVARLLRQLWPDKRLDTNMLQTVFGRALVSESQVYLCATDRQHIIGFASLTLKNNLWQEGYLGHIDEFVVHDEASSAESVG